MNTLVIGLGNPILTDDGVGVKVAYEVEKVISDEMREYITVTEASAGGLRLMEAMIGYDRVILVDALLKINGNKPGSTHRMTLDDLRTISPTQHSASAHDTTLVTALDAGREMGLSLPDEIIIFAIEVENVMDFSDEPTPDVAKAIPKVTDAVMAELTTYYNL
ncbi:MAG: hydrogenase maturation protease [Anaerolineales bacterium]|nr:hydrogenase maturation protease [Anaerolineales bacterium]